MLPAVAGVLHRAAPPPPGGPRGPGLRLGTGPAPNGRSEAELGPTRRQGVPGNTPRRARRTGGPRLTTHGPARSPASGRRPDRGSLSPLVPGGAAQNLSPEYSQGSSGGEGVRGAHVGSEPGARRADATLARGSLAPLVLSEETAAQSQSPKNPPVLRSAEVVSPSRLRKNSECQSSRHAPSGL